MLVRAIGLGILMSNGRLAMLSFSWRFINPFDMTGIGSVLECVSAFIKKSDEIVRLRFREKSERKK